MKDAPAFVACSDCFTDRGLRLDAESLGIDDTSRCSRCESREGFKLTSPLLERLAHRFFVWGSLHRYEYGAAPLIQFNQRHKKIEIRVSPWLQRDVELIAGIVSVGFFYYGPHLWMLGEVEPLKDLQAPETRADVVAKILREYPEQVVDAGARCYRIRRDPRRPEEPLEYDSLPSPRARYGRLDSEMLPVLYASPDLEVCLHECRIAVEDELYVATLSPRRSLRFLNLTALLREEDVTEFESLDMAVHMLFLAGEHSYEICRTIASVARNAGFDGLIYPSYFSMVRNGIMPFATAYGISRRRIPSYQEFEEATAVPNLAIFGRPLSEGLLAVECINRVVVTKVAYQCHFGPVICRVT